MKKIIILSGIFIVHTLLFIGLFHTGTVNGLVFFYRGLFYLSIMSISLVLSLSYARRYISISTATLVAVICVFISIHSMFFTLIPVTLDRSLSIFMLRSMDEHSASILSTQQIEKELIQVYIQKNKAVDKRMKEQLQSGTVTQARGGFQITPKGRVIVRIYTLIGRIFGITPSL